MTARRHTCWVLVVLAGTAAAQSGSLSPLARDLVAAHNAVRAQVGLPPLVWSDRLAARARNWAETLLAQNRFDHTPNSSFGENLFEIRGGAASPAMVVYDWAGESRDYDYRSNRCRSVCGHYTQIVWRSTKEVGCAVARGRGREVWVCNYDPPGNYIGERPW